ncbi:outer membrane protein assembly factor BamA [Basilea psittacipulmonis]|uniref:Outer membrane protein assembly factor BamA n=1 Tax=Basilea psittacipulmonis DSM 24701 TaxID=1072685 RepID=A0A077DGP6_9BURK|nr:outer membrane protein assembly factor BamA [Basilea psittacipulmonis]AIL32637.1 membrane protein [Basilea psittacipulmonis DSM 24701]
MASRPFKTFKKSALFVALGLSTSMAAQAFIVKDIQIKGLESTDSSMIYSRLPIKVGQDFNAASSSRLIHALYNTGLFSDVQLFSNNGVLTIQVKERPIISAITIKGARVFSADDITKGLANGGLSTGRTFDPSMVELAINQIKQEYQNRGRYGVDIQASQTPLPNNRVGINFTINEGVSARIENITIIGNHAFSTSKILDSITSTTPGFMTWYTGSDKYSADNVTADINAIRNLYLNNGYFNVIVAPPQVAISPTRQKISLTYTITEGSPYHIQRVRLAGNLLDRDGELYELVTIKDGELYNAEKLNKIISNITDHLGKYGFAMAKATPSIIPNEQDKTLDIVIDVQPGRPVYVRRINIGGNTRTRDAVIRREIRQQESAWYNSEQLALSQLRLNRLGYFDDVKITQAPVADTNDQIDIDVNVVEKPLGMINLGVGYGSTDKLSFQGSISQSNIFGSGTDLALAVNTGRTSTVYSITHVDPYFTSSGISRTTSLYYRKLKPYNNSSYYSGNYSTKTLGLSMNFGIPISETDRVYSGFTVERNIIELPDSNSNIPVARAYHDYVDEYGKTNNSLVLNFGWGKDTRNDSIAPTEGHVLSLNADVGVWGLKYYLLSATAQKYVPLSSDFTLAFNFAADYGRSLDSSKSYPVIKNVYLGGIGSVRGYDSSSLGPRDLDTGDYIGGQARLYANAQLYLPFPGTHHDRSLRWFLFADAGKLTTTGKTVCVNGNNRVGTVEDPCGWRYSAGVGLSWNSPIGPLQFSYARPLNKKPGDATEYFQFQIGTSF